VIQSLGLCDLRLHYPPLSIQPFPRLQKFIVLRMPPLKSSSRPPSYSGTEEPAIKASDEATPLLAALGSGPNAEPVETSIQAGNGVHVSDEDAPLPKTQIFLLSYARIVEPIAFFSIFPYINQMIEETGIDKKDVPFYSGLIESLFSATQMLVMVWWGKVRAPETNVFFPTALSGRPFRIPADKCRPQIA